MNGLFSLKPEAVMIASATDKQDVLRQLSALLASVYRSDSDLVAERLQERENLGSTGFGNGVAIPHSRIPGLQRPVAGVIRLEEPVDFNAADGLPVDLIFGLLSPEQSGMSHLKSLAAIARLVRDDKMRDRLSSSENAETLYALLDNVTDRDAA
ncbi:PTS sugar transporter subunit IIA [Altericroceibacterium endophyticum]|uniref:PTS transporter subunit EIIA n=1 Tax=Altericroceibacterium endophyticum TaxID=1808508 RepID=A0A6I4T6L2_9SPHN|nr:PTS sugar transporter subunit IIA [Altericroceibacterium endophyticum]MXO65643.1 PTS transporter subunit EIIA [Altericroceibacterium endophyticum]